MSEITKLTKDLYVNKEILQKKLPIGRSFDVVGRDLVVGQREAYLCIY